MRMYYVTGISAVGKSAVQVELRKRGYIAYDSDSAGITRWRDKRTGELVDTAGGNGETHDWYTSKAKLVELGQAAGDEPVFICGTSSNRHQLWDIFTKVFCLVIDEKTLRYRLATRTSNNFGKQPQELADILGWHDYVDEADIKAGAIKIDASKPISEVVDEILSNI